MAEFEETAEEAFEKLAEKHRLELTTFQAPPSHPPPTSALSLFV